MAAAFLSRFTLRYKKIKALKLAATSPQGDHNTMVQYQAHFEVFLLYVDVARNLDDVIDAFLGVLKSTLVGGASLLR